MSADSQAIVHDFPVPEVIGTPAPVVRTRRLHPLYYLHNFRLALAALKERYSGLLSSDEAGFIEQFAYLSEASQCLLTRLVMRKGPLFRRATLQYAEVWDLDKALDALVAQGWIDADPLLSAEDLFRVLNAEELRVAVGTSRGRRSRRERPDFREIQLALPLQDQPAIHRSLAGWNVRLAGGIVKLRIDPLIKRLQLLFFGNHHQTWAEFALADLGVHRYEAVAIGPEARAFHSREEIIHFYRLNDCRARLEAGEAASGVRESAFVPEAVCSWLRARFGQLLIRIGELLEAQGSPDLALQSYRDSGSAEGLVRLVLSLI